MSEAEALLLAPDRLLCACPVARVAPYALSEGCAALHVEALRAGAAVKRHHGCRGPTGATSPGGHGAWVSGDFLF